MNKIFLRSNIVAKLETSCNRCNLKVTNPPFHAVNNHLNRLDHAIVKTSNNPYLALMQFAYNITSFALFNSVNILAAIVG